MGALNSFEELEAFKQSRNFRNKVFNIALKFPLEERNRLTNQIVRSSRSITANIAEGFGRFHHQENIQFCRMSRGSLQETLDHLICACDCSYIDSQTLAALRLDYEHCLRLINGNISYLKKAKQEQ